MSIDYKLTEIAAILDKTTALVSYKLHGKVPWNVDEIQKMYDVLGDDAWEIYNISKFNREVYKRQKSSKTKGGN